MLDRRARKNGEADKRMLLAGGAPAGVDFSIWMLFLQAHFGLVSKVIWGAASGLTPYAASNYVEASTPSAWSNRVGSRREVALIGKDVWLIYHRRSLSPLFSGNSCFWEIVFEARMPLFWPLVSSNPLSFPSLAFLLPNSHYSRFHLGPWLSWCLVALATVI